MTSSSVRPARPCPRVAAVCSFLAAACSAGAPQPPEVVAIARGVYGSYWYVNVSRPTGGTIRSEDGRIDCGVAGSACGDGLGQTRYEWSQGSVTLTAVADTANGYVFRSWGGDCSGTAPTCTLTAGADRLVAAVFDGPAPTGSGQYGVTFLVNVVRPLNGMVTSDGGAIACGTTGTACSARFPWASTATLRAVPDAGYGFQSWAGDCGLVGPCLLDTKGSGADKTIIAVFAPRDLLGHGNWTPPIIHGAGYFDYLANATGALDCPTCHGGTLAGMGNAPSCHDCHARASWTGWQTNCSFCHGARDPGTMAGYELAAHPRWSAPPDSISQRLTGTPAPDRTGAHQAHLSGATAGGLSFAAAFSCATCHPVPADLSHVGPSGARAVVVLRGAGQASLPEALGTYDAATGTCATYCHGSSPSPAWSFTGLQCAGCHALPPPTSTGHPPTSSGLTGCAGCHGDTVDSSGALVPAGKHLDGVVQVSGGHPDYSSPAVHGPEFFAYVSGSAGALDCSGCHGATFDGGVAPSCTACHLAQGWVDWKANCSFCHGTRSSATMAGYDVGANPTWSAPPDAVSQRLTGTAAPDRTGAHQAHLTGTTSGGLSFAGAFACETCHAVPGDLTHVSGKAARAAVALTGASQASLPALLGSYDVASGTCTTYCHGETASPAWSSTGLRCDACHGLPPPPPTTAHPPAADLTACSGCHPDTMNADGTLNVAGGKHVDGIAEATAAHGDYTSPATHGPAFFRSLAGVPGALDCRGCHGTTYGGGSGPSCDACHASTGGWTSWQTNCSFCHGARNATTKAGYAFAAHPQWSAPPDALSQRLGGAPDATRTGGHQAHLTGTGSDGTRMAPAFPCATCHAVPGDLAHAGGPGRAPVVLSGAGQGSLPASLGTYDRATGSCTTYCHGSTLRTDAGTTPARPVWSGGAMSCSNSCHGSPPSSGRHDLHVFDMEIGCGGRHAATTDSLSRILDGTHVNGVSDVVFAAGGTWTASSSSCAASCHGNVSRTW